MVPRCCSLEPSPPRSPPAEELENVGEKGHFPGCFSSCSRRTLVLGEKPGIQDGLVCSVRGESSPSVLQSLWPGHCPKEAAVRVAVDKETEARSWAGIRLPSLLPGRVAGPRGGGLGWAQGQSCPVPGGLGRSPRFGIAVGHRRVSLSPPPPQLSRLCPHPLLVSQWGRQEEPWKNFQDFHDFFQLVSPCVNPRSTVVCLGEREF